MKMLQAAIPDVLGQLFEGGKIIPSQMPAFLAEAVKIRPVPGSPHDVDLDVNIDALKKALFRHGFDLLEAHKYEEGAVVYRTLLELWPRDAVSHYNLACAEALLGHTDSAIQSLTSSVDWGYCNLAHLLKDSDLDSIRSHLGYLLVVETLKAQQAPIVVSASEPSSPEESNSTVEEKLVVNDLIDIPEPQEIKKVEEEPISEPEEQKVEEPIVAVPEPEEIKKIDEEEEAQSGQYQSEMQLLADMGFANREKNLLLLLAESGDLANVVHRLFAN